MGWVKLLVSVLIFNVCTDKTLSYETWNSKPDDFVEEGAIDRARLEKPALKKNSESTNGLSKEFKDGIDSLNKTLMKGEKFNFAVKPNDPRYRLSSEVLRGEATPSPNEVYAGSGQTTPKNFKDRGSINYMKINQQQAEVPDVFVTENESIEGDFYFIVLVAGFTALAVFTIIGAGICFVKLNRTKRDAADTEYPAYGVTGPNKEFSPSAGDRKLAQSAHMFHYQHQKQQMLALGKNTGNDRRCSASDGDSDEEDEEGDYTVYECPGLAPTGEMEVKNPLFSDDPTPVTPQNQHHKTQNGVNKKSDGSSE